MTKPYSISSGTIFHALDTARLDTEKQKMDRGGGKEKIRFAAQIGGYLGLCRAVFVLSATGGRVQPSKYDAEWHFTPLIVAPLAEEVVFRYLLQKQIYSWVEKKTGLDFLKSKSFRILSTNALFALYHGKPFQTALIGLLPANAIVFEVTDSLKMSILSHFVNNLVVVTGHVLPHLWTS